MNLYKYQGAGNDFLLADNRRNIFKLNASDVEALCNRHYGIGADGLMLLERGVKGYDFSMIYYNSDGSGGMMCGNGGRCIVAFAHHLGFRHYDFMAPDGPHHAEILSRNDKTFIVKLGMKDVSEMIPYPKLGGVFMDTGTRHFVKPVSDIAQTDVYAQGKHYRYLPEFAPIGVNVNFTQWDGDTLMVRTYEKGVENETCACGTGITASAIAAWHTANPRSSYYAEQVTIPIQALNDALAVEFQPTAFGATNISLIGPAKFVARIQL